MAVPHASKVTTAANVAWSDATLFDGYLLFILATPALGAGNYPQVALKNESPKLRLPRHIQIPIQNGVVSDQAQLARTDKLAPPNCKYCWWVYDVNDAQIAQGGTLIAVTAAETAITPPTLTAPTAAAGCVSPETSTSGEITNIISTSAPTREDVAGTKNGVNTAFTISSAGSLVILYWNGQLLDEGVEYTRSGVDITMISPALPESGDSFEALIFA